MYTSGKSASFSDFWELENFIFSNTPLLSACTSNFADPVMELTLGKKSSLWLNLIYKGKEEDSTVDSKELSLENGENKISI